MTGLVTAVGWFTRIPVGTRNVQLDQAVGWLPAVGLLVAGTGIAVRAVTLPLFGGLTSAVLTVAAAVLLTGAFHEDGLADSADALWGGWTTEDRLRILRDSRLGTYGVAALALSLILRVAVLASLDLAGTVRALVAAEVLGRFAVLPLVTAIPPARTDGQLASLTRAAGLSAWVPAVLTTALALGLATGWWAVVPLAAAALPAAAVGMAAKRRLGGVTGDLLGAANQMAHLGALLAVLALVRATAL